MRPNQDPNPNRKCLVSWNSTVDAIKQLLVLVLNCLSSDVALGGGAGESTPFDDDDVFGGGDALVDIAAGVELSRSPDDLLLELLGIHGALLRSLDKQGRGRPAVPNDDALEDEFNTCGADVVLDRLGVASETVLALDPIIFSTPRKVLSGFGFEEEVTGVEVAVRVP